MWFYNFQIYTFRHYFWWLQWAYLDNWVISWPGHKRFFVFFLKNSDLFLDHAVVVAALLLSRSLHQIRDTFMVFFKSFMLAVDERSISNRVSWRLFKVLLASGKFFAQFYRRSGLRIVNFVFVFHQNLLKFNCLFSSWWSNWSGIFLLFVFFFNWVYNNLLCLMFYRCNA